MVIVEGQGDLLEVVGTLRAPSRLAGGLDSGQQQGDQDRDDGDDHQKLNQRETATIIVAHQFFLAFSNESERSDRKGPPTPMPMARALIATVVHVDDPIRKMSSSDGRIPQTQSPARSQYTTIWPYALGVLCPVLRVSCPSAKRWRGSELRCAIPVVPAVLCLWRTVRTGEFREKTAGSDRWVLVGAGPLR